jgi:hypothetical protein
MEAESLETKSPADEVKIFFARMLSITATASVSVRVLLTPVIEKVIFFPDEVLKTMLKVYSICFLLL